MAIDISGLVPMKGGRLRNLISDLPAAPQQSAFYPSQLYLYNVYCLNAWIFLDFLTLEGKSLQSFRTLLNAFTLTAHNPCRQACCW